MTRSKRVRSDASKEAHWKKYISKSRAKVLKGLEANMDHQCIQFNGLATRLPSNANRLNCVIAHNFPELNARDLPPADPNHHLFIMEDTTGHPLTLQISNVITHTTTFHLENACRKLDALGPKIHHRETNQSETPTLLMMNQEPPVLDLITKILRILQEDVAPKLGALLKKHYPAQWERDELAAMPWLDFGGAFFTVAIKVGSSECWHIDWNDDRCGSIAWVVPIGEFTGGDFCSPQLLTHISICRGQVLEVQAWRLIHCGLKTTGVCHVFTLFTDGLILKHADKGK
ncbi:hypothetical protein BDN71DRAFT_1453371 [Pleurotus eryngii]|uniref:Uncharacterized protein n=1 Tax=Pleurotus eryngii TaxID=5323 RepID=A0A9P5ZNP8_PLEER|nr:hypothetical protein BDN71DRAFT_1453371 [Pleurotus eryngii]